MANSEDKQNSTSSVHSNIESDLEGVFAKEASDAKVTDGSSAQKATKKKASNKNGKTADTSDAFVSGEKVDSAEVSDASNAEVGGEPNAEELMLKAAEEIKNLQDKYVRLQAEWDTYRRRTKEQAALEKTRASEKLLEQLIPVIDDLERSIAYAKDNGEAGLLGGVEAIATKLGEVCRKDGLEEIFPKGEPFDALSAQAVATVEDKEAFDETIAEVLQKGYKIGKKVLRPAMVSVTTGGPRRSVEEKE